MNIFILGYIALVLVALIVLRSNNVPFKVAIVLALTSPISLPLFALGILWLTRDEKRD